MARGIILWLGVCTLSVALSAMPKQVYSQPQELDTIIRKAFERNPRLQSMRLQSESAALSARAAGTLPDPQIGIGLMNLPHSSLALDETPMSGVQVGITQRIPWPGELSGKSDVASLQARISRQQARQVADEIARRVAASYYDYSYWIAGRTVLQDNLALTEALAEVARTRYANGDATMQEVLRAKNARERLNNRLRMFARSAESALLELQLLVDDTSITVTGELPEPAVDSTAFPLSATGSVERNPLLQQADLGVERADATHGLARAAYWPDLTLGVDYRFRKAHPMDAVGGEDFLSFRVGISVPLWFMSNQKQRTASARIALDASRSHRHWVLTLLKKRARDIRQTQQMLHQNIGAYESAILPQSQAAFESARAAYEVGQVDFDALLAAQLDWLNARLERLELLRTYHQKQAELDEVLGRNHTGSES